MNRFKNIFEFRTIFFTLFIIVLVGFTGVLLYKRLAQISNKIIESSTVNEPVSLLTKQIILDLRTAENNARSFQLTHDVQYISLLYNTEPELEENISTLKRKVFSEQINKSLIDSFINLSHLRFELIKTQSYISDPAEVAEELNIITSKIEETYPNQINTGVKTPIAKTDTIKKKKSLFKRLFGSKNKAKQDTSKIEVNQTSTVDLTETKKQLKKEVQKVKKTQLQQLAAYKKNEYEYNKASQIVSEKMTAIAEEFKKLEELKSKQLVKITQLDINTIKNNAIVFSIVISLFLFMLTYLIVSYIRKKQHYEAALIESKRRSDDLAKAKELFLANMSHEIKTPLNAIYGFTEQLLSSDLKPEQKQQINIVKNSAAYLTKLVSDILTYSKLQAGKSKIEFEPFNLKNELLEIESLFKIQANNKHIHFEVDTSHIKTENIVSDLHKLKQVLFNIIGNAIKFTNKGDVNIIIHQIIENNKGQLEIAISDTGIGIEEEKMKKLFNEYEQGDDKTNKRYGGTGLGLVITKQILQQLGGDIKISSKYKKGTVVSITVPFGLAESDYKTEQDLKSIIKDNTVKLSGKKILIVDDEEFNRLLLKSILTKYNIRLYEALNGEEAVTIAKNNSLDAIIMDIRMPLKNGIEATKEIRAFNPTIPIIASTAVASEEKIAKCFNAGVTSVVFKPFNEQDLISALTEQQVVTIIHNKQTNSNNSDVLINFNAINDYTLGDEKFKKEMIETFKNSIHNAVFQMNEALLNKNHFLMSDIAHKILPSCKHFEAEKLTTILKTIENTKSDKTFNELQFKEYFNLFEIETKLIIKEINRYLNS